MGRVSEVAHWRIVIYVDLGQIMTRFLAATLLLLAATLPVAAQDFLPKVESRLISERSSAVRGGTITVALEEKIRSGWHTYWVNPGDAGVPTTIN